MSLLNSRFTLPSPIVLSHVPSTYGVGIQYASQPSDDCSCGASKTVCPSQRGSAVADSAAARTPQLA
jgi:hypothetical protein